MHLTYGMPCTPSCLLADYFLLRRFMRARTYDLPKALAMFLDNIAWRKENQVDSVLQVCWQWAGAAPPTGLWGLCMRSSRVN